MKTAKTIVVVLITFFLLNAIFPPGKNARGAGINDIIVDRYTDPYIGIVVEEPKQLLKGLYSVKLRVQGGDIVTCPIGSLVRKDQTVKIHLLELEDQGHKKVFPFAEAILNE